MQCNEATKTQSVAGCELIRNTDINNEWEEEIDFRRTGDSE